MPRRWPRLFAAALAVALAVWFLWSVRPVLAPFLLAALLAYVLSPVVAALAGRGFPRAWAILLVYAMLALMALALVVLVLPAALEEMQRLSTAIPQYAARTRDQLAGWQQGYRRLQLPRGLTQALDGAVATLEARAVAQIEHTLEGAVGLLGALGSMLIAPIIAFYLLRDQAHFRPRLYQALPRRYRGEIGAMLGEMDRVVAGFVRGQLTVALMVGALVALAVHLLGLRFALILGLVAALADLVPYIGPILGALPAVAVGLLQSPLSAVQIGLAFFIIQQIESAIISPKVVGENVGLHPLAVMFALLAGGYLAGIWGLILAVPVAGIVHVAWLHLCARLTA